MVILSLGWGVQSWGMAAMSALGVLSHVDLAIHSDTGWERQATYDFAARWTPWLEDHGIPVVTVHPQKTGIEGIFLGVRPFPILPAFTFYCGGSKKGMLRRRCSYYYKVAPIRKWLFKRRSRAPIDLWIGISADEAHRAKPSGVQYIHRHHPLLPFYTRKKIISWLRKNNLEVPPRSFCTCCPFHTAKDWAMVRSSPSDWSTAVSVDEEIRDRMADTFPCFLHRQRKPLSQCVRATRKRVRK